MEEKEALKFEADDMSELSINGKQVFFTKRINGKTTHNKVENTRKNPQTLKNNLDDEDLFVEFKTNVVIPKEDKKTKKRKKHRKGLKIISALILILIIIGICIFAMVSPIFDIKSIQVEGNKKLTTQTIISLSELTKGENIFRISKKQIEKKIKSNSYVEAVNMKRNIPDTILLEIKERQIAYKIKVIDSYVYLDFQGYILEKSSENKDVPLLTGFSTEQNVLLNGKRVIQEDIDKLKIILKIVETAKKQDIYDKIQEIEVKDSEYILKNEDIKVYLGEGLNLNGKIEYLKIILENEEGNKGEVFLNGDLNQRI